MNLEAQIDAFAAALPRDLDRTDAERAIRRSELAGWEAPVLDVWCGRLPNAAAWFASRRDPETGVLPPSIAARLTASEPPAPSASIDLPSPVAALLLGDSPWPASPPSSADSPAPPSSSR